MLYATHAVVDLAAIRHNLTAIRQLAGDRQILMALKADGYGHGAVPIAKTLQAHRLVDWFGVATTPEGIALREAGITLPILRLSPAFPGELPAALDADLTLVVHDEATIQAVAAAAASRQIDHSAGREQAPGFESTGAAMADAPGREPDDQAAADARSAQLGRVNVHLAIDTGMHRLGCPVEQAQELARLIEDAGLNLQGIGTHLPVADLDDGAEFTRDQLARFLAAVAAIQADRSTAGLPPVPLIHASNSGALLGHELTGLTMVRPGIACYGLYEPADPRFRPALELKTKIAGIRRVPAGESVGYGRTWVAAQDAWIATVPVGYADGYSRLLSNRGRMLVSGQSYPVVGRICMDQTMINLGPAEQPCPAKVGDEVVVIGRQGDQQISVNEIAAAMGTISYEVTCALSARVPRITAG